METGGSGKFGDVPNRLTSTPGPLSIEVARILSRAVEDRRGTSGRITQQQLADSIGVTQSQVSKYLRGERVLTVDQLDVLCLALSLSIGLVIESADRVRRRQVSVYRH